MMIKVGSVLNKRYKIIKLIGSGGTAHVYLAKDLILDREVSVKILRFDVTSDERALKRFHKEARSISELTHPNIVSLYDVDNDEQVQYLVMEYVEGMDLKKYIRENYPLPIETVVGIMQQITQAVYAAHQHGIIHRDLKPQNILIRPDGQIKITDFGIATGLNDISMTQTNTLVGSIHYLSPEQARGQSATNQSDIYALGIMMYELIVGNVPFNGDTAVSIAMKHFQQDMPSVVAQSRVFVPQSVENVILKATAKLPENRYPSAYDMYDDLKKSLLIANHNVPKYVEPKKQTDNKSNYKVNRNTIKPTLNNEAPKSVSQNNTKQNKKKKWLWIGLGSLISVLCVIALVVFLGGKQDVSVPDVKGLRQTEATKKLSDAGLIVDNIEYKDDKEVEKDRAIGTAPEVNSKVKTNSKVTLIISSGFSGEEIGDYRQKNYDEVYDELTKKGLIVEKKEEASTTVDLGKIISQSIAPGTKIETKNKVITLVVSSGAVSILDYTNQSYASVKADLEAKGIVVSLREEQQDDKIAAGNIISQSVSANTKMKQGATISFVVSVGKGITMENVVDQNAQSVKNKLEASGMVVSLVEQESSSVSAGKIISQSVSAGTKLSKGTSITLTVSKGVTHKMPNLLGSSQTFAQNQLEALGVKVVLVSDYSTTYAKGTVSKQSVLEGSDIVPNMTVVLTISQGTSAP